MRSCSVLFCSYVLPFLAVSSFLFPHPVEAGTFILGPALIVNQASLGGDTPPDNHYEGITGFGGGIVLDYYLKDDVALSFQPMFVQKGADLVWERHDEELGRVEFRSNYISIPVALRVMGTGRNRLYAHGGIDFSFLLNATRTENGMTEDFDDGFETFELGASFGLGGLIAMGSGFLMVEGRYAQGLSNIVTHNLTATQDVHSVKTTGFMLIVGWLFSLGGAAQ